MVRLGASTIPTGGSPVQAVTRLAARLVEGRLWLLAVAVRVVVIGVLVAGPWTDQADELQGWDAERFQEIADRDGAAWVDQPVEYPPGSVVVFDLLAGDDVVATNRALIVASALLEALAVLVLWRRFGPRAAKAFLLVGLPLVPMGYLRLDMTVTALASVAAAGLIGGSHRPEPDRRPPAGSQAVLFAVLATAGAMIKIWPALLVAGAVAIGRYRSAAGATVLMAVCGLSWLALTGDGLEPLDQVLSLRSATGWHVESLPGSLVALFGDAEPELELNAFRVGTLNRSIVTIGRVLAVITIVALAVRAQASRGAGRDTRAVDADMTERMALVMLGAVAALLVTAPLLSPQFLLWLTPWVALLIGGRTTARVPVALAVAAVMLTGFTLTVFGPAELGKAAPALLITARNLTLLAVPIACLRQLSPAANR